jgi:hypothetical protein
MMLHNLVAGNRCCYRLEHQRCLDSFGICNSWMDFLVLALVMIENVDALRWNLIARCHVGHCFT